MTSGRSNTVSAESTERPLVGSSLSFDLAAEEKALRSSPLWRRRGHTARTLIMHPDFRLVLVVLKSGKRLHQHQTDHRISVQTLTGRVGLNLPDRSIDLPAGNVLVLDKSIPHDVVAVEDSAFLLSLSGATAPRSAYANEFDVLANEHQRFAKLLGLLDAQMALFHHGVQPDYDHLQDVFVYMTTYPDRFHHPKEDLLFAMVAERVPAARPHVDELRRLHRRIAESGARLLASLETAPSGILLPREDIEKPVLDYIALYREHMALEEREIFPLGRDHLLTEDWTDVKDAVATEDDPLFGDLVEDGYRALHGRIA